MQARPRVWGARLHDYWQQASKRGAAKELLKWDYRSAAPITAACEMRRRWCEKKEMVAVHVAP